MKKVFFALVVSSLGLAATPVDFEFSTEASAALVEVFQMEVLAPFLEGDAEEVSHIQPDCGVSVLRPGRGEAAESHSENHFYCRNIHGERAELNLGGAEVSAWGNFANLRDFSIEGGITESLYLALKQAFEAKLSPVIDEMHICGPNALCIDSFELLNAQNLIENGKRTYGTLGVGCNEYTQAGKVYRRFCNVLDNYR